MGSWTIVIHGHGQHDNNQTADVENLQREFMHMLRSAGQGITLSSLTVGSGRIFNESEDANTPPQVETF